MTKPVLPEGPLFRDPFSTPLAVRFGRLFIATQNNTFLAFVSADPSKLPFPKWQNFFVGTGAVV